MFVNHLKFYVIRSLPFLFLISCNGLPSIQRSFLDLISSFQFFQTQTSDYSIGFTVKGLLGKGLIVSNGSDSIAVEKDGTYTFSTKQRTRSTYNVAIQTKSKDPEQNCEVVGGQGTIVRGNVDTIRINCGDAINNVATITGSVTGLLGSGLQITNTSSAGNQTITINSSSFAFASIPSGSTYSFAITTQPTTPSQTCSITSSSGLSGTASSTSISLVVNCSNGFTIQGTVAIGGGSASNIIGSGLELSLSDNGGGPAFLTQSLLLSPGQTTFAFPDTIPSGAQYIITVSINASNQSCSITTGAGPAFISGIVTNVIVDCSLPTPTIVTPTPGTYANDIASVSFSTPISGAEIRWNQGNGSQADPTCGSGSTGNPIITSNSTSRIKYRQCRSGWTESTVVMDTFILKAGTPTFSITPGSFVNSGQTLSYSSTTTSPWFCANFTAAVPADPTCGAAVNTCVSGVTSGITFSTGTLLNFKVRACRVDYEQSDIASATYTFNQYNVGGTVTGLTTPFGANTLVLRNNGGDDLTIAADGSFTFATALSTGATYNATVFSNPQNPWQTCTLTNGSGTVASSNITNLSLSCSLNTYTMSGAVTSSIALPSGLSISNGVNTINVPAGATSTPLNFATPLNSGTAYNVSITAEPTGHVCAVTSSLAGSIAGTNITDVGINCVTGYRIGNSIIPNIPAPINIGTYRGNVGVVAGDASSGFDNGAGSASRFGVITGIAYDGTFGYIADFTNHAIRRVNTGSNIVNTPAGNGSAGNDTVVSGSSLNGPAGVLTDGTFLYVSEFTGNRIKRIQLSNGTIVTLAGDNSVVSPSNAFTDGVGTAARFAGPRGIALDGENLYIADSGNKAIRILNIRTLNVTTLTNDVGFLDEPTGLTIVGNTIYSTNPGNSRDCITATNKTTGTNSSFAGTCGTAGFRDGTGVGNARFNDPTGITNDGENLYLADTANNRLRKIKIRTGEVTTIAGNGLPALIADVGPYAYTTAPRAITMAGNTFAFSVDFAVRTVNDLSLVAAYRLNGNSRTFISNNHLTPSGTAVYGLGRFGETDGAFVNSTVNFLAADRSTSGNNNITMSGWFFWDGTGGGTQRIIFYNGNSGSDGSGLELNGANSLQIIRGGIGVTPANFVLPANVWVHLALVILPDDTHRIFVNGKQVFQAILAGNSVGGAVPPPDPDGFQLGSNGAGSNVFPGRISDVRIYNRPLGEGEIVALAKDADSALVGATYATHPSELLMNFKFFNSLTAGSPVGTTLSDFGTWSWALGKEGLTSSSSVRLTAGRFESSSLGLPGGDHPRTVCAWVYPEDYPALGTLRTVFRYGDTTGDSSFSLRVMNFANIHYIVFGGVGPGNDLVFPYKLNLNSWTHLCGSIDSSSTARVYANGTMIQSGTISSINTSGSSILLIGAFNTGIDLWLGKITDFRIYSKALSTSEIRMIGAQNPLGLVAYYDVNSDANDMSGFGADGTIIGSVSYSSDRRGMPNSALSVAGGNNFIRAPDTFLPPGKSPRTLCMWYRGETTVDMYGVPFGYGDENSFNTAFYIWLQPLVAPAVDTIRLWGGPGSDLDANFTSDNFIWRHVCGTNDGQGSASGSLYVNGRVVSSGSQNITIVSNGFLRIGSFVVSRDYFGRLDDLMVFNRVLSASEIRALSGYHPMQTSAWNISIGSSALKLHLTAESLSNLAPSSTITQWLDQSGNLGDFVNDTNAPSYQNSVIPFNPHRSSSSVQFNSASTQALTRTSAIPGIASDFFTFYTVLNRNTPLAVEGVFETNPGANGLLMQFDQGIFRASKISAATIGESSVSAFNQSNRPYLIETRYQYLSSINIASQGTGVQSGGVNLSQSFAGSSVYHIGRSVSNATYFNGDISEIIYFNSVLSSADRNLLHCYLSQRYNLPLDSLYVCD